MAHLRCDETTGHLLHSHVSPSHLVSGCPDQSDYCGEWCEDTYYVDVSGSGCDGGDCDGTYTLVREGLGCLWLGSHADCGGWLTWETWPEGTYWGFAFTTGMAGCEYRRTYGEDFECPDGVYTLETDNSNCGAVPPDYEPVGCPATITVYS